MRLPRQRSTGRRTPPRAKTARSRRPVAQRRTRSSTLTRAADTGRTRRTGLTSRAAVLAVAICAVVLTLAVPLQQYLAQRAQLGSLAAQERAERNRVAALEQQQSQWQDPAYIREQARERLHFVKPGETAYVIVDPTRQPAPAATPSAKVTKPTGPWYSQLWSTVTAAGADPTAATPTPKPKPSTPRPITPPAAH